MTADETAARAARARAELRETEAAFEAMRANAVEAWLASRDGETGYREALYRAVKTIDTVRDHLLALVQDGEVAAFAERVRMAEG
jgi:methylaspartate ammonia-lyase